MYGNCSVCKLHASATRVWTTEKLHDTPLTQTKGNNLTGQLQKVGIKPPTPLKLHNTMIASVSFVLTRNLISNFPQTGQISNFPLVNLTCMSKHHIPKRILNNANHLSSSIMVLQTNTMTLGKLVITVNVPSSLGRICKRLSG